MAKRLHLCTFVSWKCMNPRFMGKNNSWRSKLDYKPHFTIQSINTHSHAKVHCYIYPPRTHKGFFSKNSKFKFEVCTVCSQVWSTASQSRKESYFRIQLQPESRLKISHWTWAISLPGLLGTITKAAEKTMSFRHQGTPELCRSTVAPRSCEGMLVLRWGGVFWAISDRQLLGTKLENH